MTRISEVGKLYLDDYQILAEARSEAHSFLDSIIEGVVNRLEDQKDRMKTELFEINIWSNQASKGFIEIQLINRFEGDIIEKEKKDLYVVYKDVRHVNSIKPTEGTVFLHSPKKASNIEKQLTDHTIKTRKQNIYEPKTVTFDLSDAMTTADEIVEQMFDTYDFIIDVVKEIFLKNNY